jgi:hypothetical protein
VGNSEGITGVVVGITTSRLKVGDPVLVSLGLEVGDKVISTKFSQHLKNIPWIVGQQSPASSSSAHIGLLAHEEPTAALGASVLASLDVSDGESLSGMIGVGMSEVKSLLESLGAAVITSLGTRDGISDELMSLGNVVGVGMAETELLVESLGVMVASLGTSEGSSDELMSLGKVVGIDDGTGVEMMLSPQQNK